MGFKKTNSPIKQFGSTAGIIGNAMNTINNSTIGQQWASRNSTGTPTAAKNIDPNTAAMMNVAARPLFGAGSMASDMAKQAVGYGGITGIPSNLAYNPTISPKVTQNTNIRTNMNTRPQTPINPKALGNNTRTIANMYGRNMPGSFDRNMGPLAQMADPLTGQVIDPTMDQSTAGMNPVVQGDTAIAPPEGVEVPITPIYDINQ